MNDEDRHWRAHEESVRRSGLKLCCRAQVPLVRLDGETRHTYRRFPVKPLGRAADLLLKVEPSSSVSRRRACQRSVDLVWPR